MILDTIKEILYNQLGVDKNKITPSTNITSELGADSLDLVEMMLELESRYDVQFDDIDTSVLRTIQDIVDCVEELSAKKK